MFALALAAVVAAEEPPALPDQLPPLDEHLVQAPASPVLFFGQLRLRGELDDARDFARDRLSAAGVALTGRVGVDAEIDGAKLDVVVGDGGRVGPAAVAPALVSAPALPFLWQTSLTLPFSLAGLPAAVDLGRMPVVVADGRLVGTEPFDPRGRTLDGASLRSHAGPAFVTVGTFLLDETNATPSFLALLAANARFRDRSDVDVDVYGLLHRDNADALTLPTAGARVSLALPSLGFGDDIAARAGADVQAAIPDGGFVGAGDAGHAEAGARLSLPALPPAPFVDVGAEITAGAAVAGRVFRTPAPTQHDALGLLDLVAWDNTWSASIAAGIAPPSPLSPAASSSASADARGLVLDVRGRVVGIVDPNGPLLDTAFQPLAIRKGSGVAFFEIDAGLELPIGDDLALGVDYGVALPGAALIGNEPAQRLLVSLRASAEPFGTASSSSGALRRERAPLLP